MKRTGGAFPDPNRSCPLPQEQHIVSYDHLPHDVWNIILKGFDFFELLKMESITKKSYETGFFTRCIVEDLTRSLCNAKWSDCVGDGNDKKLNINKWNYILHKATHLFIDILGSVDFKKINDFRARLSGLMPRSDLFKNFILTETEFFDSFLRNCFICDIDRIDGSKLMKHISENPLKHVNINDESGDLLFKTLFQIKYISQTNALNSEYQTADILLNMTVEKKVHLNKIYDYAVKAINKGALNTPIFVCKLVEAHFALFTINRSTSNEMLLVDTADLLGKLALTSNQSKYYAASDFIFSKRLDALKLMQKMIFIQNFGGDIDYSYKFSQIVPQSPYKPAQVNPSLLYMTCKRWMPQERKAELLQVAIDEYGKCPEEFKSIQLAKAKHLLAESYSKLEGENPSKDQKTKTNIAYIEALEAYGNKVPSDFYEHIILVRKLNLEIDVCLNDGRIIETKQKNGDQKVCYSDGAVYIGKLSGFTLEGWGKMIYPDGKSSEGLWINDKLTTGTGFIPMDDGSSFDGKIKNGVKVGTVTYVEKEGNVFYRGHWNDEFLPNGSGYIFCGKYIKDERQTEAKMFKIHNGQRAEEAVEGIWDGEVLLKGKGKVDFGDFVFEGKFKNIMWNGDIFINSDGGKFEDSIANCEGTMYFRSGETLSGVWREGELVGEGLYTFKHGFQYIGPIDDYKPAGKRNI